MTTSVTQSELDAGRGYERLFVPALFAPWPDHVISAAQIGPGQHVLDVACGTGLLARRVAKAVGGEGHVVGLDPAPGMLAVAAEMAPEITWISGAAEALPFEEARFDCVVSQFGVMFFDDREVAASEMRRVLKPGGRVALALWSSLEENPTYAAMVDLIRDAVSGMAAEAEQLPFSLGAPEMVEAELHRAGFEEVGHITRQAEACFPSLRVMVEAELRGWLPLFGINLSEAEIADVLAQADARLRARTGPEGQAIFDTQAYIVTGRCPEG